MCDIVFPLYYLAPLSYYKQLVSVENPIIDIFEHYERQTYRNRIDILSANGRITLSIPVRKHKQGKLRMNEVFISYAEDWQKIHWRSIESAYRKSSFFEFYEPYFRPFYSEKNYESLIDWNLAMLDLSLKLLKLNVSYKISEAYIETNNLQHDLRRKQSKLQVNEGNRYIQVFSDKHGFHSDLSIIDVLFNNGPQAIAYLK